MAALTAAALLAPVLPASGSPVIVDEIAPRHAAVVALIDTGINPYSPAFRDYSPIAYKHPSKYIPGFPKDGRPSDAASSTGSPAPSGTTNAFASKRMLTLAASARTRA